ncbi:hypothetical protein IscW_ISCW022692 [Ixodes scapularis]|uniref:Uncharacterized protein n=1 Tax=Ixodes scapularis TaxID=6945 RepID=B7QEA2_IXOSC|nr:hypothetical protein IscW_ISCW022692 [Ixodes scapularis]|eukprot:XP_002413866.1 hypothetical protein IscW_ISCW022692 [Ixodes scapularis]
MGLALCRPHGHAPVIQLDSNEFARLVRLFEFLDKTQMRVLSPVVSRLLSRHRRDHVYRYGRAQARGGFIGWVSLRHLRPYILKEQFIQDSVLTTLIRHLVDIVMSTEPRSHIFNECYLPQLYRSSVESGSTKGTEVFTEKVW